MKSKEVIIKRIQVLQFGVTQTVNSRILANYKKEIEVLKWVLQDDKERDKK